MWKCTRCRANNIAKTSSCTTCGFLRSAAESNSRYHDSVAMPASASEVLASSRRQQHATESVIETRNENDMGLENPLHAMSAASLTNRMITTSPQLPHSTSTVRGAGPRQQRTNAAAADQASRPVRPQEERPADDETQHSTAMLNSILQRSSDYGRDVELAIEHLARLLHQKTVECDGLRALANENYAPLRKAVRSQYELTAQAEAKHQTELRSLQLQIDQLLSERDSLQADVRRLQAIAKELETAPPRASYNPSDRTLFNRLMQSADGAASWSTQTVTANAVTRDVIGLLQSLDNRTANVLDEAGLFSFVKVTAMRMCSQIPGLPPGHYPSLSDTVTAVLREKYRSGVPGLAATAAGIVPSVTSSDRSKVSELFLANNPQQYDELERLLTAYAGREEELYRQLKQQYSSIPQEKQSQMRTLLDEEPPKGTIINKESDAVRGELVARIMVMYSKYNPSKLGTPELTSLLDKYSPQLLLDALVEKYGPEPTGEERRALIQSLVS